MNSINIYFSQLWCSCLNLTLNFQVLYLKKIGGNSEYECVKRIYSRIIKNEIACEYNWHGLKGKKALKESLLAKASVGE